MITQPRRPASIPLLVLAPIVTMTALLAMSAWLVSAPRVRAAETVTVDISNFTFNPGTVTIQVGDTVTWTNNDTMPHTATATDDPATFDGGMQPGESFSFTFDEEGTFDYFCEIHPQMEGTVVVEAAAASPSEIPDGALSSERADGTPPVAALGIALIALSLLAGIGVARRRAGSAP
jgi:plastocyanin